MLESSLQFEQQFYYFDKRRNIMVSNCLLLGHVRYGANIFLGGKKDFQLPQTASIFWPKSIGNQLTCADNFLQKYWQHLRQN